MSTVLITGSNRGIGLELASQYAEAGWRVYATCRHPAEARTLHALAASRRQVSVHHLDVTVAEDIRAIAWELENIPLDILFNNAGVYLEYGYQLPEPGGIRYDHWLRTFDVNTLGAVRMTEALLNNVAASERRLVAVMTSHMGSTTDIDSEGSYYYRSSKAALNASMRGLAIALQPRKVGVLLLHPGAVQTRMGPDGGITPAESVRGLRSVIDGFSQADSGSFVKYDGTRLPW
ncbi:MAG: SDR family oxidoreductase [Thiogranum sp.]|nr:SDR family oxidoreductase [Thiogranum sp.]